MISIDEKRIEELNKELNFAEASISFRPTSMTVSQFEVLRSIGTVWNLNLLAGKFWYYDLHKYLNNKKYDIVNVLSYFNWKNVDMHTSEELLQGYVQNQVITLDEQLIKRIDDAPGDYFLTPSDLIPYMELLAEHQIISANTTAVDRWGFTSSIDIDTLRKVMIECDIINSYIVGDLEIVEKSAKIDGNHIMNYGWSCVEFGLYAEAEYIFKTFYDFKVYVKSIVSDDTGIMESLFIENNLGIITTMSRSIDVSRFTLSVGIGLAKIYVVTGRVEEAKEIYREILNLFPNKTPEGVKPIHYWVGINRIIESGIELYNISDDVDKPELKSLIIEMFIEMRRNGKPNNFGESVHEPLLVIYMMLTDLYK